MTGLLEQILAPGGLRAVFQPIYRFDGVRLDLHGVECLTRGPRGTNVEGAGVLFDYVRLKKQEAAVNRACIRTALAAARILNGGTRLSLNAHATTLVRDEDFAGFLEKAARENGIAPERITLEIVEHSPTLDGPGFSAAIESLRRLRVRIALDDVGVGASNLRMILDCRPDFLKLDRYFVDGSHADDARSAVLEAMVLLAPRLGAAIVAEGVELPMDLHAVSALGVRLFQGNLLSPAMPADELIKREPTLRRFDTAA